MAIELLSPSLILRRVTLIRRLRLVVIELRPSFFRRRHLRHFRHADSYNIHIGPEHFVNIIAIGRWLAITIDGWLSFFTSSSPFHWLRRHY